MDRDMFKLLRTNGRTWNGHTIGLWMDFNVVKCQKPTIGCIKMHRKSGTYVCSMFFVHVVF